MKEIIDSVSLPQLETLLENLERSIATADRPHNKARMYNLAGDMCFDARQPERGLAYYDKAITTYTDCAQYPAAGRICEKILALSPDSVRPYSTLAWLALMQGRPEDARHWLDRYVMIAEAKGLSKLARDYLVFLADLSKERLVLESIADGLLQLNDGRAANAIYGRIHA